MCCERRRRRRMGWREGQSQRPRRAVAGAGDVGARSCRLPPLQPRLPLFCPAPVLPAASFTLLPPRLSPSRHHTFRILTDPLAAPLCAVPCSSEPSALARLAYPTARSAAATRATPRRPLAAPFFARRTPTRAGLQLASASLATYRRSSHSPPLLLACCAVRRAAAASGVKAPSSRSEYGAGPRCAQR